MEETHQTHKVSTWGWTALLHDWRRSRTRIRTRAAAGASRDGVSQLSR